MSDPSKKKNIGVFFGSGSPEHDVSIITGQLVISGLKQLGYPVTPVYITKDGSWLIGEELGSLPRLADPRHPLQAGSELGRYYLDFESSRGKMVFKKKGLAGKKVTIDLAFPALHGSFGEDGTIQGLFEMIGLPYVGCGVTASAVAMDKALAKQVMASSGIPTVKFVSFNRSDWDEDSAKVVEALKQQLRFPVFVKPVHLGSSIGIAKVAGGQDEDLRYRIEVALHYDNKILVEEAVEEVMDVTCCLLGHGRPKASLLQESVFTSALFDFEEKYLKGGGAQLGKSEQGIVIPARLPAEQTLSIRETAKRVYEVLGCSGIARVDFLVDKRSGAFFANEINPMPGTLYHHLWKASGLEIGELLESLLAAAEQKHAQTRMIDLTFESGILKQLGSAKFGSSKLK